MSDSYSDNGIVKVDYAINSRNNLAARYFGGTDAQTAPVGSPYHDYYQVAPSRMHNFSIVLNSVINPKLVAQTLVGVNYSSRRSAISTRVQSDRGGTQYRRDRAHSERRAEYQH